MRTRCVAAGRRGRWHPRQNAAPGSAPGGRPRELAPAVPLVQEEMYSFVTLAEDPNVKKGVVILEA